MSIVCTVGDPSVVALIGHGSLGIHKVPSIDPSTYTPPTGLSLIAGDLATDSTDSERPVEYDGSGWIRQFDAFKVPNSITPKYGETLAVNDLALVAGTVKRYNGSAWEDLAVAQPDASTLAELFATSSPSNGDTRRLVNATTGALVGIWRYSTVLHDLGVWVPVGIIWIKNAGLQGETIFGVATDAWPSVNGGAGSSAFTWVAGGLQFSWGSPAPKAAWEWPLVSRPIDWSRIQSINLMSRWDKSYSADFVGYCGEWDDADATGNRTIVGLLGATNQYGVLFGPWRAFNSFSGQPDKLVGSYNRSGTNVGCGASCMFDGGTKAQSSTHSTQNHEAGDTLTNFGVYINATGGVSTNVWEACQFDIIGYSE